MSTMKLKSSDERVFSVDIEVARVSVTIKTMLNESGITEESAEKAISLPNISAPVLEKVINWCTHHKDDPTSVENDNAEEEPDDDICEWDQQYVKIETSMLSEIIEAANYLQISGLVEASRKAFVNAIDDDETTNGTYETFDFKVGDSGEDEKSVNYDGNASGSKEIGTNDDSDTAEDSSVDHDSSVLANDSKSEGDLSTDDESCIHDDSCADNDSCSDYDPSFDYDSDFE